MTLTIPARQLRVMRSVLKRVFKPRTGPEPRVSFEAGPGGLVIQTLAGRQAVEYRIAGEFPVLSFSLPFGELPAVTDRGDVTFAVSGDRLEMSWNEGRTSHPLLPSAADRRALPSEFRVQPAGFRTALADASATTDTGSIRYALGCLQLRGDQGQIVATDGLQLLVQSGFEFPWTGDLLVPGSKVFAAKELDRNAPVEIGRTEDAVVLRTGLWTFWLPIETQGRFPKVDAVIPQVTDDMPAAEFTADDRQFLFSRLKELPGSGDNQSSVTLDLNGEVIVRARATPETPVKEVVLTNSRWTGPPLRIGSRRNFLARAVQLGFERLVLPDAHGPASCRDERRTYVWAVLEQTAALPPGEDSIRIESPAPSLRHLAGAAAEQEVSAGHSAEPVNLRELIEHGEQLQRQLRSLQGDVRQLVTGLRAQRPRSRRRRVSVPA